MGQVDDNDALPRKRIKLSVPVTELPGAGLMQPQELATVAPSNDLMPESGVTGSMGSGAFVGPSKIIRRYDLVRIITQSLHSLGYKRAAAVLERESGICMEAAMITELRKEILKGHWDASIQILWNITDIDSSSQKFIIARILSQKFFERLNKGDTPGALEILQLQITPLKIDKDHLHELTSCIICPSKVKQYCRVKDRRKHRVQLLKEIQGFFPACTWIPESRLEHLLEQALSVQKKACIFHNSKDEPFSLYSDHVCGSDQIPTQTLQVLTAHQDEVWCLQFSNNGKHLASASKDCTSIVWQVLDNGCVKLRHRLTGHQAPVSMLTWSPDDQMILTCGIEEVVKLWNAKSGVCIYTFMKPGIFFSVCAWFPYSRSFVSGGEDKGVYLWSVDGMELECWEETQLSGISDLTITPDGNHMISVCRKIIRVFSMHTKVERFINEEADVTSLSVSKDGKYLLVNLVNDEIHLWKVFDSCMLSFKYWGHKQSRFAIRACFGGFNQVFIASGSEDSQVYIWHRSSGQLLEVLSGHSGTVNCVNWSPVHPTMFASSSDDHTIRIWGLNSSNKF